MEVEMGKSTILQELAIYALIGLTIFAMLSLTIGDKAHFLASL